MELALYVHVPFCVRKCYYCDFVSINYSEKAVESYLLGVEKEFELYSGALAGRRVTTLYIGGGTPSCLASTHLAGLLEACHRFFPLVTGAEVTVEVNPGTITREKAWILKDYGVNRISLGVQAFQDEHLTKLGRIHGVADILQSYNILRDGGFDNISFDLMFALPGQCLDQWEETLDRTIELGPEHISTYSLTIEEGTMFHRWQSAGQLKQPDEEVDLAMYQLSQEKLTTVGYCQYEISNFAIPRRQSRHNLTYWFNKPYLGIGPGAHAHLWHTRWGNEANLTHYLEKLRQGIRPVVNTELISLQLEQVETVILGLRLLEGINREAFKNRFGRDIGEIFPEALEKLQNWGLLEITAKRVRLTPQGLPVANRVFLEFLPD